MASYWKTSSHVIAFGLMIISFLFAIVSFFVVIGIGVSVGKGWAPDDGQVRLILITATLFLIALGYFFVDLSVYVSAKRKHIKQRDGTIESPINRGYVEPRGEVKRKTKSNGSAQPVFECALGHKKIPYISVLFAYIRAILGLFITILVLLIALIAVLALRRYYGADPYTIVMLCVGIGLAVFAVAFIFSAPVHITKELHNETEGKFLVFEDRVESHLAGSANIKNQVVPFQDIITILEMKGSVALIYRQDGRRRTLFVHKGEALNPKWIDYLKERTNRK